MYQSAITPSKENLYPIEGLLLETSYQSHMNFLRYTYVSFKQEIKKDLALLDKLSFQKESWLITNENDNLIFSYPIMGILTFSRANAHKNGSNSENCGYNQKSLPLLFWVYREMLARFTGFWCWFLEFDRFFVKKLTIQFGFAHSKPEFDVKFSGLQNWFAICC